MTSQNDAVSRNTSRELRLTRVGKWLADPKWCFFTLIWLMVLVVIGTVSQKTLGLYAAEQRYFSSFLFWQGGIPLPGGYSTIGLLFINLLCKLVFASQWNIKQSGVIVTHLGALLLLLGGLFTAMYSEEGFMLLFEGEQGEYVTDYHARQLQLLSVNGEQETILATYSASERSGAGLLRPQMIPATFQVKHYCRNCARNEDGTMVAIPNDPDDERNVSGVTLVAYNKEGKEISTISIHETMPEWPTVTVAGKDYTLRLAKRQRPLPFRVELIDFQKTLHPGTDIPSGYASEVRVIDGNSSWHSIISMNEPLRYKGYTLYQSSFVKAGEEEATVLAVVKNIGRMFPYISSIVLCIGLLVHLGLHMPRLLKGKQG